MKNRYKKILSRGETVGGKQVQNDKMRDCRATLAMTQGEQRGRSMVEMLGVLAVIGVLSVAGIAGYSIAMRSYRTNEIVNAASMLHILAMAQNAGNGPTANVGYTDVGGNANPSGVSTLQYNKDTKEISITFTDPDDCIMAKNKLGDKATGDCPSLTVSFEKENNDSGVTTCTPTCSEGQVCVNGSCENKAVCTTGSYDIYFIRQNVCGDEMYCINTNHGTGIFDGDNKTCNFSCDPGYRFYYGSDSKYIFCLPPEPSCESGKTAVCIGKEDGVCKKYDCRTATSFCSMGDINDCSMICDCYGTVTTDNDGYQSCSGPEENCREQ